MPKTEITTYKCDFEGCDCKIPVDRVNVIEGDVEYDGMKGGMTTHIAITKNGEEQFFCPHHTQVIASSQWKNDVEELLKTDELHE